MAKTKRCNAIVHGVYAGDGIRLYYEKPDVMIYSGKRMSLTEAFIRASVHLALDTFNQKRLAIIASFSDTEEWPPHSLFCDCPRCLQKHANYKKLLKG